SQIDNAKMVMIPGGNFLMGSPDGEKHEAPVHQVWMEPFLIDKTAVTNRLFSAFVAATGYRTIAERVGAGPVQKGRLFPGSVKGANGRHPAGPQDSIQDKMSWPVVHVCFEDVTAYCQWSRKRLPTEAEWERAARGSLEQMAYPWGNEAPTGRA